MTVEFNQTFLDEYLLTKYILLGKNREITFAV